MAKVSIIVPVIYREDLLKVCLDSLIRYTTYPYELIVVWEGTDEKVGKVIGEYSQVKVVHNPKRKGFAGAMNSGMAVATGDYYCFLNSDTVATPGWLEPIMAAFIDKSVGLVSPRFTEMEDRQVTGQDKDFEYLADPISLKGVCLVIPKVVIDDVGKWDERFGLGGGDDNDMCLRVSKKYKLVVAKKSYLYHYGSASFREEFNQDNDYSKKYAVGQFNKFRDKHDFDKEKKSVFISIPCADGKIHYELGLRLIQWSHDPSIKVKIQFYPNIAPLDNARNRAVKAFLEDYYDYFFHVDADIVPPVQTLKVLLEANKEVIAPLCFTMKQDDKGLWFPIVVAHRYDANREYRPYYGKGIEETDVVTGGCHLVKREVFEKLERPYYFTYHKNGTCIYSEDFVFSQQCQELGYKLYTDYDLHCKHIRYVDVKDINDFMVAYGR